MYAIIYRDIVLPMRFKTATEAAIYIVKNDILSAEWVEVQ